VIKTINYIKVENQAGERAGGTECPRLLSHRRAKPAVAASVCILKRIFLGGGSEIAPRSQYRGYESKGTPNNAGFLRKT